MSAPSMVHRSGDTLVVRSVVSGDHIYEESEDETDLPQCKIKRNYTCTHCTYYTQNPRSYLYHLKDEHGEKIRVYECPSCLYASKHSQKLQRHVHMVHVIGRGAAVGFKKKKGEIIKAKLWNNLSTEGSEQMEKKFGAESKMVNVSGNITAKMSGGDVQECSLCTFTSSNPSEVLKHERTAHLKKKFYRCSKCNYVTHMKARYTKHVKYHSMPMIKCDLCDFRTPYKWNLDRHYKNHTGDGAYRCALCNFTADIKQSLTVHEMNHHVPPVGQPASAGSGAGAARRRNKVGASDSTVLEEEIDQEELELLRMEREDAADSSSSYQAQGIKPAVSAVTAGVTGSGSKGSAIPDTINVISSNGGSNRINATTTPAGNTRRTPKIKVTFKKLKTASSQEQNERHNFQADFIHPDDIIHHKNGNVYIKNLKCRMCNYKAAWEGEMARHESKAHGIHRPIAVKQTLKKVPRPIPNLIPIQNKAMPTGSVKSLPILRIPTIRGRAATSLLKPQQLQTSPQESGLSERDLNEICAKSCPNSSLKDFASLIGGEDAFKLPEDEVSDGVPKKTSPKQGEEKYFDEDEIVHSDMQSQTKPDLSSSRTDSSFKKKNASFFDKLKEKLLVGAGESCNLVCACCGHESKCLSELARHQKLHSSPGNHSSDGSGINGGSGVVLASGAELSSTRCQHCRQRCKTSADLVMHLQSCSEANKKNLLGSSPSPLPTTEITTAKEEKVEDVEDEEEEEEEDDREEGEKEDEEEDESGEKKAEGEEPHPMENKVFVWNNLPQPAELEHEEAHQLHSQTQQQQQQEQQQQKQQQQQQKKKQQQQQKQEPPLQQILVSHQQDEDSLDASVRSKSPISEGSLVGIETAPGYGAVTSKIASDSPDGLIPDVDSKTSLTVKKVFKCPNCSFWASTASRFHVHIVGHLNKKPFECSLCAYRSNWRWDITKHIRLKSARDVGHERARVLMTDETGRRNYSKYNKYLTLMRVHEPTAESSGSGRRTKGLDVSQGMALQSSVGILQQQLPAPPRLTRAPTPISSNVAHLGPGAPLRPPPPLRAAHNMVFPGPPPLQPQPSALLQQRQQQQEQEQQQQQQQQKQHQNLDLDMKPKRALKRPLVKSGCIPEGQQPSKRPSTDSKKTLWKCKKCNYRDASRELVLAHVKEHYQQRLQQASSGGGGGGGGGGGNSNSAEASVRRGFAPFRCGHCHQVSNWKHVIQRHCRLKHSGDVRVVIGLKEGGTVEERFMIDDGNAEVDTASTPPGRPEGPDAVSACDKCPFTSDSATVMGAHKEQHLSRPGAIFKCYFCPFYVSLKRDLLQHMRLHGVTEPEDYISKAMQGKNTQKLTPVKAENRTDEQTGRQHHCIDTSPHKRYKCVGCPYVSNSKSQFLYHKQFHRPRGAPFKCGLCSYNVSRRHLLHQHLRVHGILIPPQKSPTKTSDKETREDGTDEIEEVTVISQRRAIPMASESVLDTRRMTDIPLVWVSRGRKFSKMFKCRFCPHVNLRKANIQEHEKMHRARNANGITEVDSLKDRQSKEQGTSGNQQLQQQQPVQQHHCPDCNYICNNAGVLSSHAKVHQGVYGQVHCLVDTTRSDEAQLQELSANMSKDSDDDSVVCTENKEQGLCEEKEEEEKEEDEEEEEEVEGAVDFQLETSSKESGSKNRGSVNESGVANNKDSKAGVDNGRLLYFCSHCPARFLFEKELTIHNRFHEIRLAHRCESCSYTARQRPHLLAHLKVHTEEYQERTNMLSNMYKTSPQYPRPRSAVIVEGPGVSGPVWVVISGAAPPQRQQPIEKEPSSSDAPTTPARPVVKQYACKLCPARFFKFVALEYHTSLHGGSGPHKCRSCDYAVKTYGNLVKHEMIHDGTSKNQQSNSAGKSKSSSGTVPLSGTELFQQRTEAQKQRNTDSGARRNITDHPPLHVDPQFGILMHGNPDFIYPTYLKNGRLKEKRYKCHKCPSAFEKREQYKVHLSLHGSKQRYKCEKCDYSVKYYANYIQHMRKHKNNEEALEARKLEKSTKDGSTVKDEGGEVEAAEEMGAVEDDIPPQMPRSMKTIGSLPTGRHGPLPLSMADRQTILLLQQRRSSNASSSREGGEERKCFRCPHCPYSSQRRDGVESHTKRHLSVSGVRGAFICSHCDYTVPQLHFLREHNKVHFKKLQPDVYMKYDRIELWACEDGKENMNQTVEGFLSNSPESSGRKLVFHDTGNAQTADDRFYPVLPQVKGEEEEMEKVYIDLRTGEPICEKSSLDDRQDVVEEGFKELVAYNTAEVSEKNGDENMDSDDVEASAAASTESTNADDSKSESSSSSSTSSSSNSSSSSSTTNSTSGSDSNSSNSSNSSNHSSTNSSSNSSSSSNNTSSSDDSDSDDSDDNICDVKSGNDSASTCSES